MAANATQKTRSWKSESHWVCQEISRIVWNLKVRYAVSQVTGQCTTNKVPWDSIQRIFSNLRPTVTSGNMAFGKRRVLSALTQCPGFQTTLCRQSETANSTHIKATPHNWRPYVPFQIEHCGMPRGQGATYYEVTQTKTFANSKTHKICFGELSEKVSRARFRKFVITVIKDHKVDPVTVKQKGRKINTSVTITNDLKRPAETYKQVRSITA